MSNTLKTQIMKRLLTIGLMLASAFALTNCTEQIASPNEENVTGTNATLNTQQGDGVSIPYEVYVDGEETKTIMSAGKTYWVDASTAATNGLEQDKIILYSADAKAETPTYTAHKEFLYVGNQKFTGDLANGYELPNVANWCCIYPYPSTPNTTSTFKEKLTIGESAITVDPDCMDHMMGKEYPMYGIKNNVPISKSPNFKMSHLFAIVALEIVNEGDGITGNNDATITIKNAEFDAGVPIVGDFDVNILASEEERYSNASSASNSVRLKLNQDKVLHSTITENTTTLYFAVKPFDASNREITIRINSERNDKGELLNKDFAEKKFVIPANVKFRAGKVTTIRVPVKLSSPKTSNAKYDSSTKKGFITIDSKIDDNTPINTKSVNVNGEQITADVIYQRTEKGWFDSTKTIPHNITITGNVPDLLNALDACFYASAWKEKPAAMTISNLNLWINGEQIGDYVSARMSGVASLMKYLIDDGVVRDKDILSGALVGLTDFIAPQTITFAGIVSNGATGNESIPNILMLDDNTIQKQLGVEKIDQLLREKFDYVTPEGITLIPTAQGLIDIVNTPATATPSAEALKTAEAIYGKLDATIGDKVVEKFGISVNIGEIFRTVFTDYMDMLRKLPLVKVSVTIENYPYSANTADYGSKGDPKKPNKSLNPIVIWGLHADGM